jgi:RNA methyltransferase, TrmH family
VITSTQNRRVAAAARLRKRGLREQDRRFLVEGAQGVAEALEAGAVETVFHTSGSTGRVPEVVDKARSAGLEVLEVAPSVIRHLTSAVTPQGVVAVARFVDVAVDDLPGIGLVSVLASVRDPGNAGAILRSADAAGAAGVVFTRDSVDAYNPKSVRASAGSLFHVPVVRDVGVEETVASLREQGARVLAAASDGEVPMDRADLTGSVALLLGNEAWGLPSEVQALADATVRVPIHGSAESLNLAAAATLLMFEAGRQRSGGPEGGDPNGISRIVSASVHDARLPLTALKGFTSTLVDRWDLFDDPTRREMVGGMVLDVERVASMITLMVEMARIDQVRFRPAEERRDVGEIVGAVVDLFARSHDYPDVIVTGGGQATVERDRLLAVLLAMCDGAMWWGQEGPIEVDIREQEGEVSVDLRRSGTGPTDQELALMFRGPETGGSKIALYLAHRVTEADRGILMAEGGHGITFRLRLPAGRSSRPAV